MLLTSGADNANVVLVVDDLVSSLGREGARDSRGADRPGSTSKLQSEDSRGGMSWFSTFVSEGIKRGVKTERRALGPPCGAASWGEVTLSILDWSIFHLS